MEVSSFCPTQLPGHMAAKWFPSTRTPLRASQAGQETPYLQWGLEDPGSPSCRVDPAKEAKGNG